MTAPRLLRPPKLDRFREKLSGFFLRKHRAYADVFLHPTRNELNEAAKIVLADLRRYCAMDSEGLIVSPVSRVTDPYAVTYRAGRRDVYLRITKYLDPNFEAKYLNQQEQNDERESSSSIDR